MALTKPLQQEMAFTGVTHGSGLRFTDFGSMAFNASLSVNGLSCCHNLFVCPQYLIKYIFYIFLIFFSVEFYTVGYYFLYFFLISLLKILIILISVCSVFILFGIPFSYLTFMKKIRKLGTFEEVHRVV